MIILKLLFKVIHSLMNSLGKLILIFLIGIFLILMSYNKVSTFADKYIYEDIKDVADFKVGLLLGTSKFYGKGLINPYYQNRIDAAHDLYLKGKIEYILVSGDNSTKYYNEPEEMQNDLMKLGVPKNKIILDHAGLRTLDSVIRAKQVFGQNKYLVISQKFHNERAIYIGRHNNIEIYGYNAESVEYDMFLRELMARIKMFLDLYIGVDPKFLGEKIEIN